MNDLLTNYVQFITTINDGLEKVGIAHSELAEMDHICYRVETNERYQEVLALCKREAIFLGENEVGGRMIATFEFKEFIQAAGWTVPYFELPAPKEGSPYTEGLEHAELVVIGGLDRFLERHAELPFSRKGMNKVINPEAGLKMAGMSVKFHEQQLGAVVRIENRLQEGGIVL